jgi:serine/threonine protein kinase
MFHTAMERAVVLTEARNKLLRIPAAVQTDYPLVHELVSIMTSHNPALRPSADEILLHPLLCTWPAQLLRSSSAASTPVAELSASQSYCSDANLVPSLQASPMKSPRYFSYERTGVQQQQQRILELETTVELLMQQIRDLQCQLRERSR